MPLFGLLLGAPSPLEFPEKPENFQGIEIGVWGTTNTPYKHTRHAFLISLLYWFLLERLQNMCCIGQVWQSSIFIQGENFSYAQY